MDRQARREVGSVQAPLQDLDVTRRIRCRTQPEGASVAQQYLAADLVDEMEINLVPTLLRSGERLFEGVGDLRGLELVRTVPTPGVTHLKFTRR